MKPKVSVIIPAYNRADTITRAVLSAYNQNAIEDVEIIVVDDGSTDNTEQVLNDLQIPINYIRQDNGGVSKARNTGLKAAKGDYVALLDSDDFLTPYSLAYRVRFLATYPEFDVVTGGVTQVTDDLQLFSKYMLDKDYYANRKQNKDNVFDLKWKIDHATSHKDLVGLFREYVNTTGGGIPFVTSTVMLRKEILESVGYYNESLPNSEDLEFFVRLACNHNIKYEFKRIFAYINMRTSGISKSIKRKEVENYQSQALKLVETHFNNYFAATN